MSEHPEVLYDNGTEPMLSDNGVGLWKLGHSADVGQFNAITVKIDLYTLSALPNSPLDNNACYDLQGLVGWSVDVEAYVNGSHMTTKNYCVVNPMPGHEGQYNFEFNNRIDIPWPSDAPTDQYHDVALVFKEGETGNKLFEESYESMPESTVVTEVYRGTLDDGGGGGGGGGDDGGGGGGSDGSGDGISKSLLFAGVVAGAAYLSDRGDDD